MTPEAKVAYEELDAAIRRVHEIEGWGTHQDGSPMVITDYVVLAAGQGFDTEGGGFSSIGWILMGQDMPWWKIIGVVRSGLLRMEYQLSRAGEDE